MSTPAPGSARQATAEAAAAEDPGQIIVSTEITPFEAVPVVTVGRSPAPHASYRTVVLPAGGVLQVVPRDSVRQYAWIIAVDAPIVLATSKEQAQASNSGATVPYPNGSWLPQNLVLPVTHSEPVWAAETTGSAPCRVSVMTEMR